MEKTPSEILAAFEASDRDTVQAVAVAACHAEDIYVLALAHGADGDAARVAMARAFLGSLAVGVPVAST